MPRLALTISTSLIGSLALAGCGGQSTTTAPQSNDVATASPTAGAPAVAVGEQGATTSPASGHAAAAGSIAPGGIPDVPAAVQIVDEGGKYAMRTNKDDAPLYTYDRDQPGKSNCNDSCAKTWPPLTASADAKPVGNWTVVTRADGSHQWASGRKPVYAFSGDTEAVAKGDGTGGVWHLLPSIPAR